MQEKMRRGTQEAPKAPDRGAKMILAALGHVRVKSPDTVWARVESWSRERSGRFARANVEGCLMGHSSLRLGKPATWRRTPRKHAALKGNSCRTLLDRSTRVNLTGGNSHWALRRVTVKVRAEASATEEPDAGKPHVRVCAGGAPGNGRSYRGCVESELWMKRRYTKRR